MRALQDNAGRLGPRRGERRQSRRSVRPTEAYPPAQFLTDVGIVLILHLTLALVFHLLVIIS